MTRAQSVWGAGAALLVASAAGALLVVEPIVAAGGVAVLCAVTLALCYAEQLPRAFATAIFFCLFGYAFLGKGFAYFGAPPLFVGEMVLTLGVLAVVIGRMAIPIRSPIVWLVIAYGAWGAAQTLPYLGAYRIDALRDATIWGYAGFAVLVSAVVLRLRAWTAAIESYARWFWWFAFWAPVAGVIFRVAETSLPVVPGSGGIPVLFVKAGDFAVQLAGLATFVLLGLADSRRQRASRARPWLEWVWWASWLAGLAIAGSASRGGLMSVVMAVATVVLLQRRARWWKPAIVLVVFGAVFSVSEVTIDAGQDRKVSAEQIIANVRSIGGGQNDVSNLDGTRAWRLQWWTDIVDYTVHGPYFWTGKGFGVNLADDDGYQGTDRGIPNRSPHNIQMTVLARAGVPGLVVWTLLHVTFALSMFLAYVRARRARLEWWARVNLWILAYWVAFMTNAAFDVYLEGPQGAIWFWCVIGFGIAALEAQRQAAAAPVVTARVVHDTPSSLTLPST